MTHTVHVIGLGAGGMDQLPLGVYRTLKSTGKLVVRTASHPVLDELQEEGLTFSSYDDVYEAHDQFEAVYAAIVEDLLARAGAEDVWYAVPGHPLVAEQTVQLLFEAEREGKVRVSIVGGQSFLDDLFTAVKVDPIEGFQLLDGTALERDSLHIGQHVIIGQVYDAMVASDVKLTLMERYPDDYPVTIVTAAGSSAERVTTVPLYELDQQVELNNLTSLYVPPIKEMDQQYREFSTLRSIIATLRGPDGCPWDKEQTHESLKRYLIEETYELLEAIDEQDDDHIIEELGDVLLQVLLHAQIGEDDGYFSIEDVISTLAEKMVRRHPHVFGTVSVESSDDVVANWQEIKQQEKGQTPVSLMKNVGEGMPSLVRATEVQKKAAKVGFDWEDSSGAWDKFEEEWQEFQEEVANGNKEASLKEFGDVLFSLVNVARFYKIYPEEALTMANQKFINRFTYVEKRVVESGKTFQDFRLSELDAFWNEAKESGL